MTAALVPHEVTSTEFLHIPPMELRIRDLERESKKLISQELHCTTLAEYCRTNRIPRGLRSHLRPTLFKEDESYCNQFENILNKCSFDLMVLTIKYLQKSIKEMREKITTIELQLTSCLPEEEWKSLKAKMGKVLMEFRKETELKKREKFLQDMEDYQLKQVYRWQDPPSGSFRRLTYTRPFTQDETNRSGSEYGSSRRNPYLFSQPEMLHQSRSQPTADIHHGRQLNTRPNALSDEPAVISCIQRGREPWIKLDCGIGDAGLQNLKRTPGSCISQSYRKNRIGCIERPARVVLEKSKSRNKLIVQKDSKNGKATDRSLPVSKPASSVHDKKEIVMLTESHAYDDTVTTASPLHQTGSDQGLSQHHSNSKISDKSIERLEQQGNNGTANAKYISRQKSSLQQSSVGKVICGERSNSAAEQKKQIVTYPGKRPCTCVSASENADVDPDSKKICTAHPTVDKGFLTAHSVLKGQSCVDKHTTRRKKYKKSNVLGSKIASNCKFREKYLERKGEVLFQKVSWKLQECKKCRKKFSIVVLKTRRCCRPEVSRWSVRSCTSGQSKRCTKCKKMIQDRRLACGKEAYSCTECGKSFLQRTLLDLHQKSHIEEKLFVCPLCGKRFVQHSLLLVHQKTHTVNKPYQCMDCGNQFFSKSLFAEHLRTHKETKPFNCTDCGKCFADNTTLIIHQRTHTGEKPFSCNECGKRFSQHSSLVPHQRIHSGEKPYECHVCGKRFRDRSSIASHQRIHNGEKPFKCQECDKRFTQSCNLRRHERLHMGQKPYVCTKCGKAFNESTKLKSHENVHLKKERREAQRTNEVL